MKYLNKDELQVVADKINTRLKTVTEMPSSANDGAVRLYVGEDTADYKKGHIYQYNNETYYCYIADDAGYYYHFYIKEIEAGAIVYACGSPEWFQKKADSISELTSDFSELGYTFSVTDASPSSITVSNGGLSIVANHSSDDDLSNTGWTDITASGGTVDLNFNPTSENAQSGIAVSQALKQIVSENTDLDWESKTWTGVSNLRGQYIWTDSENNIYYSCYSTIQYVLNKSTGEWETKTWSDFNDISGDNIWKTDENIYYSLGQNQYIFNKSTGDWEEKVWYNSPMYGCDVWTDGINLYFSYNSNNWVYNKATDTWEEKTWYGLSDFRGLYVWTDGTNIYYSKDSNQYILNKATDTWESKTWYGLTSFTGYNIWTDGVDFYYSEMNKQYKLNKSTNTWESVTWSISSNFEGINIWKDKDEIYLSDTMNQYKLKRSIK